jgi:hypothetical protein
MGMVLLMSLPTSAQQPAAQQQYEPQTAPLTAPSSTPPSDSSSTPPSDSSSTPPSDSLSTTPETPTSEPSNQTPTAKTTPDSTAPTAPEASQVCRWELIPPGAYPGGPSGCPWWRGVPGGSKDLGNGQCYYTQLGVSYSCSGESPGERQTSNPGDPGVPTPNPGDPGGSHLITGVVDLLSPMNDSLIRGVADLLGPILGAPQGESQKIDKTGQDEKQNVGPGGIGPIRTIYCMVFPNDSSCLAEKARQVPQPGKEHTLQPPSPLGSPDLKRAL